MTNLNNLTDRELDQVCGGMDCKTAIAVASVYISVANVLLAADDSAGGAALSGRATGMIEGGCSA